MVVQLWFRDGQGEAGDGSTHNTAFAWERREGAFTERGLRTARRVGEEEGLFESWVDLRPSDRRRTVFYRLNLWEVARCVARSELKNVSNLLARAGRSWNDPKSSANIGPESGGVQGFTSPLRELPGQC